MADGWEVFEAPGVQPYFGNCQFAINYAKGRTAQRKGEIRIIERRWRDRGDDPIRRAL